MATNVRITFSGLCLFSEIPEDEGGGVRVRIPMTSPGTGDCTESLEEHHARLITTMDHMGGTHKKVDHPIFELEQEIVSTDGNKLAKPSDLVSIGHLGSRSVGDPVSGRVLAELRLRGGSFGTMCRKASSCFSGGWMKYGRLRWQDTWAGTIDADELTFDTRDDSLMLSPVGSWIDLSIVSLMPCDLEDWLEPDSMPFPVHPGREGPADDLRWFFWMFGWDDCGTLDVPQRSSKFFGTPYTCVMGGD